MTEPLRRRTSAATWLLAVVLVFVALAADRATAGAVRGTMLIGIPVGITTWLHGRNAGLTVAVLGSVASVALDGTRGASVAWGPRAVELVLLSAIVGTVAAASDHVRASWPRSLLDAAVLDERGMARRMELELDRLRTRSTSLVVAAIDIEVCAGPAPAAAMLLTGLARAIRSLDVMSGGPHHAWLLLPDTDGAGARLALERHRALLLAAARDAGVTVRIQIGATVVRRPTRGWEVLLRAQDAQALAAKNGRDQVVVLDRK